MAGQDLIDIDAQFGQEMDMSEVDLEFFRDLLYGVPRRVDELDASFRPYLDREIAQIDPVEKAILRMASLELADRVDVPARVVINEAVELAKQFGAEQSHKYVNGVLDRVAKSLPLRAAEIAAPR